jgi:hypothetical protein
MHKIMFGVSDRAVKTAHFKNWLTGQKDHLTIWGSDVPFQRLASYIAMPLCQLPWAASFHHSALMLAVLELTALSSPEVDTVWLN